MRPVRLSFDPRRGMTHAELVAAAVELAETLGWQTAETHRHNSGRRGGPRKAGTPDLVVMKDGRAGWIECKPGYDLVVAGMYTYHDMPSARLRPEQQAFEDEAGRCGNQYHVVGSTIDVRRALAMIATQAVAVGPTAER